MSKFPAIKARELEKALFALGFIKTRQKGSHAFYRHADGRATTVPHHKGRDMAKPLVKAILADIEISPEDFLNILRK